MLVMVDNTVISCSCTILGCNYKLLIDKLNIHLLKGGGNLVVENFTNALVTLNLKYNIKWSRKENKWKKMTVHWKTGNYISGLLKWISWLLNHSSDVHYIKAEATRYSYYVWFF